MKKKDWLKVLNKTKDKIKNTCKEKCRYRKHK